ncbi:solute carrier family 10 (sodium/bile acid cotransporter), member 7 [Loktanella fryxellensis]|uniref:Solute carrier family 10 (Sodium/bile acid cotransporter), member 7 n=1 Tax=Loktanella fryxellensis TaxID=245187 RepID=A0A1H8BVH1_9RHOB|nr:bile acid:sodium symporter family protein [Loktanella fryxellensis]SEM85867.1 solute carrier family 10 (sodium/bile acid cotransporter), member 7 [Loktanella fryxellensis]
MAYLKRLGIDTYMLLLIATVATGLILPVQGIAATGLSQVTFWAVVLLFFLYGAKLDSAAVRAGLLNLRLQGLTFGATFGLFPLLGLALAFVFGGLLGPELTFGLIFLAVLPSTVQSSIAFTGMAGGNVPAAICAASLSNLIGVVLTPALVALLLHQGGGAISGAAIVKIAVQILLPFLAGQLLRPLLGGFVQRHKAATLFVDRGAILLIVYSAFSAGTVSGLWSAIPVPSLILLYVIVALLLGVAMVIVTRVGRVCGLPEADRAVLLFCGSTKSLASGLPIATALVPAATLGATVLPLILYHLTQLLVCALIAQRKSQLLIIAASQAAGQVPPHPARPTP